jgi:hypothetical protein
MASFIGTTIEWYDFFLYGTAAALVFNELFFPKAEPVAARCAFATFAVGFAARPVGGIDLRPLRRPHRPQVDAGDLAADHGHRDRRDRLLPTYSSIGVGAPILLVAPAHAAGHRRRRRVGRRGPDVRRARAQGKRGCSARSRRWACPPGLLLSTLAVRHHAGRHHDEQFASWGWRVPFLLVDRARRRRLFIRMRIVESPAFREMQERDTSRASRSSTSSKEHPRNVLVAMGMRVGENAIFYIFTCSSSPTRRTR